MVDTVLIVVLLIELDKCILYSIGCIITVIALAAAYITYLRRDLNV